MPFSRNIPLYGETPITPILQPDTTDVIVIYVDGGRHLMEPDANYQPYQFYDVNKNLLNPVNIVLERGKTYHFQRHNNATTHPFYLSDTGTNRPSRNLQLSGDGKPEQGIKGKEKLVLEVNLQTPETIIFYCSSHPEVMKGTFSVK